MTKALTSIAGFLLAAVALLLAVIVCLFLPLFIGTRLFGPRALVLADVVNGSGVGDLTAAVPGLSALAREMLAAELRRITHEMHLKTEATIPYLSTDKSPLPQSVPVDKVGAMATSLSAAAGDAGKIIAVLSAVLPQKGTRVSTTLQRCGDAPGMLGLTFELGNMTGGTNDQPYSFWEGRPDAAAVAVRLSQDVAGEPPAMTSTPMVALGDLYLTRGAYAEAKAQYEAALAKDDGNTMARDRLAQVLSTDWTLTSRYIALLTPAMQRLSVDLTRHEVECHRPSEYPSWTSHQRRHYTSQVHNFFGAWYEALGQSLGASGRQIVWSRGANYDVRFYEWAIDAYLAAIREDRGWYQPHENAAGAYTLIGQLELEPWQALPFYCRAVTGYDIARTLLARPPIGSDLGDPLEREEVQRARRRVLIGKARALLLIARIGKGHLADAEQIIDDVVHEWTPSEHLQVTGKLTEAEKLDAPVLYNLAAWYALAYGMRLTMSDRENACGYLKLAGQRDPGLMEWGTRDPDFKALPPCTDAALMTAARTDSDVKPITT